MNRSALVAVALVAVALVAVALVAVALGAVFLASAAFGADEAADPDTPTAEEILSGTAPPGEYVKQTKCIVSTRIKRTEVLSDRFILFHFYDHGELWLARMPQRCTGMTPRSKLAFDKTSDRICQFDGVRTVSQEDTSMPQFGPRCMLPQFEPITPDQVEQLKKEIISARHRKTQPAQQ
jgi:hypothetical protein